ncbi:MAG: hypothetical protein IT425_05905 [Pirellulales bacterium]|nr:hypothetical protein [Pirellulales bacterium]
MRYKHSLAIASLLVVSLIGLALRSLAATDNGKVVGISPAKANQPISLRDRLVVGLQARLKSEVAFCEFIALKVNTGVLPQRIVDETFFWARQRAASPRNGNNYRPITYFLPAMRARAERLRIVLP